MGMFNSTSSRQLDAGLTVLRVIAGIVFVAHGWQKLFVYGLEGVAGGFAGMGVPLPQIVGPAVGALEFFGGLALIAGLFVRPIAAALAATMIGALVMVHMSNGFFMPNGYEFVFMLFGAATALVFMGAGSWSLDLAIARRSGDQSGRRNIS